jgi:MFS family permease
MRNIERWFLRQLQHESVSTRVVYLHMTEPRTTNPVLKATLLASAMLTIMAGATIAPGLPGMLEHFREVPNADLLVKLVITTTALAVALFAPVAGMIADKIGRKPLLIFGLALYVIAGTSGGWLESLYLILIGRALLGVAVASIMTATNALISDYFTGTTRGAFIGLSSAFTSFGGVILLPLGGVLADAGWHAPFWVYLASLLILPTAITVLFEPKRQQSSQLTKSDATFPRPLLFTIYALAFLHMIVFYLGPTQMPFLLVDIGRLKPSQTGYAMGVFTLAGAVVALNYARLKIRFNFSQLAAFGFALLGVGWILAGVAGSLPLMLVGFVVSGIGGGMLIPNWVTWVSSFAPAHLRGRLLGGLTTALFLGQFFSPLLAQPFITEFGLSAVVAGFGSFAVLVGLALLGQARVVTRQA